MRSVGIGIVGLGTVGGGVVRTIQRHAQDYRRAYGIDLKIVKACARSANRGAELGLSEGVYTTDWRDVTADAAVDIVVELIGGDHPATEIFEDAFAHGKHVVSANKALLGRHVEALARRAGAAGVQIRCEAAAAGGIPIVSTLERDLVGNDILTVAGIMNGTTNYILSRMSDEGLDFAEVLAAAQAAGYAEADPTADVEGYDAAAKIAILASIGFRTRVTTDDVFCEGISRISADDISIARDMGYTIKLLAIAHRVEGGVDVRVHPTMIPARHQLAAVSGAMNAVYVVGDGVGETMFYGAGAGAFPTASAVVGDVLALAAPIAKEADPLPEAEPFGRELAIRPIDELRTRYFVRLAVEDRPGALSEAAQVFAAHNISISQVQQIETGETGACQVVFVTHAALERDMRAAAAVLGDGDCVRAVENVIRIEDVASWTEGVLAN